MKSMVICGVVLALSVGCASVQQSAPVGEYGSLALQDEAEEEAEGGGDIRNWIPDIFRDLWDTVDADIGTGYGFGAHVKATNFLRLGIFDHSDFGLFGLEAQTLEQGKWQCPWRPEGAEETDLNEVLDLSATIGVGLGASVAIHPWEIIDFLSTVVGLGYWSLEDD